ncbi:MAG: tripartite tricarboxylate transporter substrate binding protein [Pseudorhodoplanes sp.]|jgi:tripartite-type tricarboxylate transporter receptor subunit TctC|nr:tripartite tricarboxylate transporter substrate binding protein [Pseudorhodoplanes sp.]
MRLDLRQLILLVGGALGLAAVSFAPAAAQDWPTRTVKFLVPYGPGGGTDIVSRIIAQDLQASLGQSFVVENKPGAGSTLGADTVAKSEKDGYTVLVLSNAHAVAGALYKKLPYDSVKDFQMISQIGTVPLLLVTAPNFAPKDVKELLAVFTKEPGKYNYGAAGGIGTTQHFAGELFRVMANVDVKHIPYKTTPAVITSMLQNDVQMTFELLPAVRGQVASGQLKALAVTSPLRNPALPDVPTLAEAGVPGYNVTSWYGFAMPAGTPKSVVDRFTKAVHQTLAKDAVKQAIAKTGIVVQTSSNDELAKHVASEVAKWSDLMKKAGIEQR